jgi:methylated-DNA-[protein]-cysteine S-methyltransferase
MTARRTVSSPIGDLILEADGGALTAIRFGSGRPATGALYEAGEHGAADPVLDAATRQLEEYFEGSRAAFDLPVHAVGTEFQRAVWSGLAQIPYGASWSYGQLAVHLGRPGAARAIGAGCGRNPTPIVVPCHRVVGADGTLTGYAGGTAIKSALLRLEARTLAGGTP